MWTYIGIRKQQQSFAHPDDTHMLSGSWTIVSCTCVQCRLVTSGGDLEGGGMFPLGVVPFLPHRHVEHFCRSSCIPPFSLKI